MKKFLSNENGLDYDAELTKYLQKGISTMAYGMRMLDEEDADSLIKQITEYQNANRDSHDKISEELLSLAQDLTFLGVLGVVKQTNYRASMVIEEACRNDIKVWMVTSDNEFKSLTDCNYLGFLKDCNQPLNIKGKTEREVEESIKNGLRAITDRKAQQLSLTSTSPNSKGKGNK